MSNQESKQYPSKPLTTNRITFTLKPQQTQKLKDICDYYGNENLLHQMNMIISSLHTALGLADNTDAKVTQT